MTVQSAASARHRAGSLPIRVLSGVVLLALCLGLLVAGRGGVYVLAGGATLLALWEFRGISQRMGLPAAPWILLPLGLYLCLGPVLLPGLSAMTVLALATCAGLILLTLERGDQNALARWALAVGGSLYVGLPLGYYLRLYHQAGGRGLAWLLMTILAVGVSDAAAYFVGSRFGHRPFFSRISPKKTVEGALAGFLGPVVVTLALGIHFLRLGGGDAVGLGLLIGAAAELGDLVESQMKRRAGLKDSSHLIPGHGGVLDRIDSALFAGVATYFFAVAFHLL